MGEFGPGGVDYVSKMCCIILALFPLLKQIAQASLHPWERSHIPYQGTFEHDFPFPEVGCVSSGGKNLLDFGSNTP